MIIYTRTIGVYMNKLKKKMEDVFVDGTMQDEMRYVINQE